MAELNDMLAMRRASPAGGEPDRLPTHGNLLADINKAAHSAGTGAWVRDVLKRAHRAIRLSAPPSSTDSNTMHPEQQRIADDLNRRQAVTATESKST